jgi:hypothetical protein
MEDEEGCDEDENSDEYGDEDDDFENSRLIIND